MNINITLLGQMITFALFVWFTMKYVWPPLTKALAQRQQKIADGLAAAERGAHELQLAQHRAADQLREAKVQAMAIIDQANKQANQIIDEAREHARVDGQRLLAVAQTNILQEVETAKQQLRKQLADIAVACAEKILDRSIDETANRELLEKMITEI